jgi:hypothetical protein
MATVNPDNSQASNTNEFQGMTNADLIKELKQINPRVKVSGKSKIKLEELLRAYRKRPNRKPVYSAGNLLKELELKRAVFTKYDHNWWQTVSKLKSSEVPKQFTIKYLTSFLKKSDVTVNDNHVDTGVDSHNDRGRNSFMSERIKNCDFLKTPDGLLLFRAKVGASMAVSTIR